jgi:plastocyanin
MLRKFLAGAVLALAVLGGSRCGDDNTISGPMPTLTATPPGASTSTPTPPGSATPTPTPPQTANRVVNVGQGGGFAFADQVSGTSTSTIPAGTTIEWVWVSGVHSTTSGTCAATCTPDGLWDSGAGSGMRFTRTFSQPGTFPYFCTVHGAMMQGTIVVQ